MYTICQYVHTYTIKGYVRNKTVTRSTYFGTYVLIIDAPSQHIVLRDKVISELTSHLCVINWSEIQYGNSIGATKYQTID